MTLRTLLLITIGLWLLLVVAFGYWRMVYAWHWGNDLLFFFHALPLFSLGLIVIVILEILSIAFQGGVDPVAVADLR